MKLRFFILLPLLLLYPLCPSYAQGDDFRKAYEEFAAAAAKVHKSFGDSVNTSFATAIAESWEKFSVYDADQRSITPQPDNAPVVSVDDIAGSGSIAVSEVVDTVYSFPSADSFALFARAEERCAKTLGFTFYGVDQTVSIPAEYGTFHPSGISEDSVGEFWLRLSEYDYTLILTQCKLNSQQNGYNDWATLEWVKSLSNAIFPRNIHSEQAIFCVFILNQLGLMVKIAKIDDRLGCLFACAQPVFARKFTVIDTYKYYLTDTDVPVSQIFTYRSEFGRKVKPIDLRITRELILGSDKDATTLNKNSTVFRCQIPLTISIPLMDFYSSYPQTVISVYAEAVVPARFAESLIRNLKLSLYDKDEFVRVNELLRFLHYDFNYKVDAEQFGYEKQFFCEENFYYGANDCEDRAVLFSFLIRNLTSYKVVLLEYDDHVSTAVCIPGEIKGSYVRLGDSKYYICDPTYIGAKAGMSIPKYTKQSAKVYML